MRKEKFDVVIDMICFDIEDAKSTVNAFRDNVEQIIICSSVTAYKRPCKTLPIIEEAESLCDSPGFKAEISLNEGLRTIMNWYENEANTVDTEKDELEDKLADMYNQWSVQISGIYTK